MKRYAFDLHHHKLLFYTSACAGSPAKTSVRRLSAKGERVLSPAARQAAAAEASAEMDKGVACSWYANSKACAMGRQPGEA